MALISKGIGISSKKLFAITILNAGPLAFYFAIAHFNFQNIFQNFSTQSTWVNLGSALFYFFAAISAFIGVFLSKRISGKKFLWAWTAFGVLVTGMLPFFKGEVFTLIFGALFGVALGLGFPYSLSLLANCTRIEQRGRVSGILLLETFVLIAIGLFFTDALNFGLIGTVIILMALRATSFLGIATDEITSCTRPIGQMATVSRVRKKETNKNFLLYFIPWILFFIVIVLTDHIIWPTLETNPQINQILTTDPWHYVGTAVSGVISGFMADRFGRKIPIVIGLSLLGFSLVLIASVVTPVSVFIHLMAIGIAFGFLMVVYIAIPGDLAEPNSGEMLYALIVVLPLAIYGGLGALPRIFGASATASALSWILTSLIFLSIVPIYIAKDTLKEEKIQERQIKEYVKKVGELIDDSKRTEKD
jgi:MFS family permease